MLDLKSLQKNSLILLILLSFFIIVSIIIYNSNDNHTPVNFTETPFIYTEKRSNKY